MLARVPVPLLLPGTVQCTWFVSRKSGPVLRELCARLGFFLKILLKKL